MTAFASNRGRAAFRARSRVGDDSAVGRGELPLDALHVYVRCTRGIGAGAQNYARISPKKTCPHRFVDMGCLLFSATKQSSSKWSNRIADALRQSLIELNLRSRRDRVDSLFIATIDVAIARGKCRHRGNARATSSSTKRRASSDAIDEVTLRGRHGRGHGAIVGDETHGIRLS